LIKSGDTLAIGGLLSDQVSKSRTKVPILGDIPLLGNAFQSHDNERHKRNLLIFVTPTIIDQRYGTGLEDQVSGVHHVGEEYADPNGWRNNAKGAVRLVPTSHRQLAADYAKPGEPPPPEECFEAQIRALMLEVSCTVRPQPGQAQRKAYRAWRLPGPQGLLEARRPPVCS